MSKSIIPDIENINNLFYAILEEKIQYQKKYSDTYDELVKAKAQPYVRKIQRVKKVYNFLALVDVSAIIYFIMNLVTSFFGLVANEKRIIDIGGTAIIIIIAGILNLVIDKFITNQADKISLYLMHNYLQEVYLSVSLNENGTAPEIIAFIKQSIAKGL